MVAGQDVERQVAVVAKIATEEAAFLRAVHGIIRGIEIQDNLSRRLRRVRLHEHVDQQPIYGVVIDRDLRAARLVSTQLA